MCKTHRRSYFFHVGPPISSSVPSSSVVYHLIKAHRKTSSSSYQASKTDKSTRTKKISGIRRSRNAMHSEAAHNVLFGWSPESESDSVSTSQDTEDSLETFVAGGRIHDPANNKSPPLERIKGPIFPGNSHRERAKTLISRGVQQAKGLARSTSHSFRRLPNELSRETDARMEDEKIRVEIEANTNLLELIGRWKDPKDRLQPSAVWRRTHPRMNYHLQAIVQRPRLRNVWSAKSAQLSLAEAHESYLKAKCPEEEMYWSHPYWQGEHLDRLARQYLDYLPTLGPHNPYA